MFWTNDQIVKLLSFKTAQVLSNPKHYSLSISLNLEVGCWSLIYFYEKVGTCYKFASIFDTKTYLQIVDITVKPKLLIEYIAF